MLVVGAVEDRHNWNRFLVFYYLQEKLFKSGFKHCCWCTEGLGWMMELKVTDVRQASPEWSGLYTGAR